MSILILVNRTLYSGSLLTKINTFPPPPKYLPHHLKIFFACKIYFVFIYFFYFIFFIMSESKTFLPRKNSYRFLKIIQFW